MGRPLSSNPSIHRIGIRLTEDEYQKVLQYCKEHSISITKLVKDTVLSKIKEDK